MSQFDVWALGTLIIWTIAFHQIGGMDVLLSLVE